MTIKLWPSKVYDWLINGYFYIAFGVYFITMFYMSFRPGTAIAVVILLFAIPTFFRIKDLSSLDVLVVIYTLYSLASYSWVSLPGFTFRVYIQEVITSIFPILFFFAARTADKRKIYDSIIGSVFICCLVGIVLYITVPTFYLEFAYYEGFAASSRVVHVRQGLSSFVGRIPLGTYTVVAAAICLYRYFDKAKVRYLCLFLFFVFSSIMTAQRSSWAGSVLLLGIMCIKLLTNHKRKVFYQMIGVFFVGFFIIVFAYGKELLAATQVTSKSLNVFTAIGERSESWQRLFDNTNVLIGRGLGTSGHRARDVSAFDTVTDGNYVKMIGEIGIIGTLLFTNICLSCLIRHFRQNNTDGAAVFVILFILVQALGSNIIALQITAPVFWMMMGLYAADETKTNGLEIRELSYANA